MKGIRSALVLAILMAAAATSVAAQQGGAIERAAWLAGCWEQRTANRVTTEMWLAPAGGLMLGASRTVINGAVREFEYLRLRAHGDTLIYTALPSGQKETDFRSMAGQQDELNFENRANDFPQVIKYRRPAADSMIARIEGPGPNGSTRGVNFPMQRVSCTR